MALGDFGVSVSPNTVARLLHQMGYSLRVNHKKLSTDFSPDRNDQFLYLSDLRQRFQRRGLPIISVDTKKRELVGNFKNPGSRWDLSPRLVNDHDFRSDSTGVAIPYGIYDLLANRGSVMVGVSHDTSAFAAHAIAHWWRQEGSTRYPRSRQLLILSDTGGSNGARRRTWKTELQSQLADSLGLTLTVAPTRRVLPNGTPLNTASFQKSPKTGQANHSTAIRRSSTSSDQPERKPACRLPLNSTVATIPPVRNRHPNSFNPFD